MAQVGAQKILTALFLGLALAGEAAASSAAASKQVEREESFSREKAEEIARKFAGCLVNRYRQLASDYVLDRANLELTKRYRRLADGFCLPTHTAYEMTTLSLSETAMRFNLAKALLAKEIGRVETNKLALAAPLAVPVPNENRYRPKPGKTAKPEDLVAFEHLRAADRTAVVLARFGECAVRADPRRSLELMRLPENSPEEKRKLHQMAPALGSCIEKDLTISFNQQLLRGAIAYSLYALAHAPPKSSDP